jgi:hypothetical protein
MTAKQASAGQVTVRKAPFPADQGFPLPDWRECSAEDGSRAEEEGEGPV